MRKWFTSLRPTPWVARRLVAAAIVAAVGVGAFCWGRHAALAQIDATSPEIQPGTFRTASSSGPATDYQRRAVATIYDNVPITREEFGEYLIARFGQERIDFLINRKIVEMACRSKGVEVSDAEVEAQLKEDMKAFGKDMTEESFTNQVLKRFNKTLYEYKEDVIRPKLAMVKLVRPMIEVTPADIQKEFEARYGPRVHCRMIVLKEDETHRTQIWERVSKSEDAFMEEAGKQFIPELASRKGDIPPIHRHFPNAEIEKEAFSLKPGQVSALIHADKTWVILRCENHVPEEMKVRFEEERWKLAQELTDRKLAMQIPIVFAQMRTRATPSILVDAYKQTIPPVVQSSSAQPSSLRAN